jgi:hypothetical protein
LVINADVILTLVMLMRWQVFFVNEFEDAAQIAQEEEVGVAAQVTA